MMESGGRLDRDELRCQYVGSSTLRREIAEKGIRTFRVFGHNTLFHFANLNNLILYTKNVAVYNLRTGNICGSFQNILSLIVRLSVQIIKVCHGSFLNLGPCDTTNSESTLSACSGNLRILEFFMTIQQSGIVLPRPISFVSWSRRLRGETVSLLPSRH